MSAPGCTAHRRRHGASPHRPQSPDLLPSEEHLLKHPDNTCAGKTLPRQQDAESAFQVCWVFMLQEFLVGKNVTVDCDGSYFD